MLRTHFALLAGAALAALGLTLALILLGASGSSTRGPSPSPTSPTRTSSQTDFDGAALPDGIQASAFTLTDRRGRRIRLGDYRGRVVILTFLAARASWASPLVAQQIRGALDDLARPAAALAISADPAGDTPARVGRLLASTSLTGRMIYLTGTTAQLRPIWHAYRVTPMSAGRAAFERAAAVLLIDPRGRERVLFGVEQLTPEELAHDVRQLQAGK
jgi:cytochrome oxidase Cu insertion factor (SCO1/SenC/PrrC family)